MLWLCCSSFVCGKELRMYSVLIADDNKNWIEILEKGINNMPEFRVEAKANDGKTAIEMIEKQRPDIIILDIIMPEFDGIYIVNHVRSKMKDYSPIIYILSGIGTDTIIKMLSSMDIDYYSMKPVTLETILGNLKNVVIRPEGGGEGADAQSGGSGRDIIKETVIHLGLLQHLKSTKLTIDVLKLYLESPDDLRMLTKTIYPAIAKKYGLKASAIEKNLRYAVSQMQKNQTELYKQLFSYPGCGKITNGEFLSVVAESIREKSHGFVAEES